MRGGGLSAKAKAGISKKLEFCVKPQRLYAAIIIKESRYNLGRIRKGKTEGWIKSLGLQLPDNLTSLLNGNYRSVSSDELIPSEDIIAGQALDDKKKRVGSRMEAIAVKPWHFTIVFDEDKATRNGYDVETLYDYVGKNVEHMGNVRVGRGTWQARNRECQFGAQCRALSKLSDTEWVMENVEAITVFDDETPEGYDYLKGLRHFNLM